MRGHHTSLPEGRYHFVLFPKKDMKDIGDVAPDDASYITD